MVKVRPWMTRAYWAATLALLLVAIGMTVQVPYRPPPDGMGPIERLLYLHLAVAINTYLASLVVFVASLGYLGGRRRLWDDVAHSAARIAVLNGAVLMLTGVLWARVAWGHWWEWSPRLAFSLVLWLLYVGYVGLRPVFGATPRGAVIAAVYGVVAFLDVPLVYLSVNLLPDVHPSNSQMTSEMRWVLLAWLTPITMLSAGLIVARVSLTRARMPEVELEPGVRGHAA